MNAIDLRQDITKSPSGRGGRKLPATAIQLFFLLCQEDRTKTTRHLWRQVELHVGLIQVSIRYLNLRRQRWGLSRLKGRPSHSSQSHPPPAPLLRLEPNVSFVGVSLFAAWLEQSQALEPAAEALQQAFQEYCQEHPKQRFPLPNHRIETHKRHFQALFFAPLFGIKRLSEYDYKEHSLPHVIGQNYHASTLKQALCRLERVDAAQHLLPLLLPEDAGKVAYIDGHMIAFWSSKKMHKGHITMLGRVMSGSQAVVTHDYDGEVIYFEYHAPDLHLTHILVDYCKKLRDLAGIEVFVIDRAANSQELARAFDEEGLGLLCMLSSNQYKGLESFQATFLVEDQETKSSLYLGEWRNEKKKASDPREFVLRVSEEKTLVYTGTRVVTKHFRHEEWPGLYRGRTDKQENSFKGMKGHGALDVNYGTKVIMGPDRHEERRREKLQMKLHKKAAQLFETEGKIIEFQEKVRESEEKGHTKRLDSRKKHLKEQRSTARKQRAEKKKLEQKLEQLEEGKERGDRDYRKQSVMTFRTFLLENLLVKFLCALFGGREWEAGLETWLGLLRRSGGYLEKTNGWEFWFDAKGLSESYRRLLETLVLSVNELGIELQGKKVFVRIRDGTS